MTDAAEREVLEETGVTVKAEENGIHAFDIIVSGELQYVVTDII